MYPQESMEDQNRPYDRDYADEAPIHITDEFYFRPFDDEWEERGVPVEALERADEFLNRVGMEDDLGFGEEALHSVVEWVVAIFNDEPALETTRRTLQQIPENVMPTLGMREILPRLYPEFFADRSEVHYIALAIILRAVTV